MSDLTHLLQPSPLLDFGAPAIRDVIARRGWMDLPMDQRIGAAYDFTRDEILFGYNRADGIAASTVLADGYGQCNTKGVLLMALLRALGVPCRMHGFTIHKGLQRGVMPELAYALSPPEILHSWVELYHGGRWITLEGFILDMPYLQAVQRAFGRGALCAYGVGTEALEAPQVAWCGTDTYIQKTGIARDLGLFDTPDALFSQHDQALGPLRRLLYTYGMRHWMNARARAIRGGRVPVIAGMARPADSNRAIAGKGANHGA